MSVILKLQFFNSAPCQIDLDDENLDQRPRLILEEGSM